MRWLRLLCSVLVGIPVDGPVRAHSITTTGISSTPARPIASVISAWPGPDVAVIARTPVKAAPSTLLIAAHLVAGLPPAPAVFRKILPHPLEHVGCRRDRIARHEPAAG